MLKTNKLVFISTDQQAMRCYENDNLHFSFQISTAKNGVGEVKNSECTPRGWHKVFSVLGLDLAVNSVLVARKWTGELYCDSLAEEFPHRDWILTRIIQLDGLEPGRNMGGNVDSLERYIYIHGTPDTTLLGQPGSHGCIRMNNKDSIDLATWVNQDTLVYIQ